MVSCRFFAKSPAVSFGIARKNEEHIHTLGFTPLKYSKTYTYACIISLPPIRDSTATKCIHEIRFQFVSIGLMGTLKRLRQFENMSNIC